MTPEDETEAGGSATWSVTVSEPLQSLPAYATIHGVYKRRTFWQWLTRQKPRLQHWVILDRPERTPPAAAPHPAPSSTGPEPIQS